MMTHSTPDRASSNTTDGTNGSHQRVNRLVSAIAQETSRQTGRAWVFALAVGTIVVWAITGPFFNFSDTWRLVINTGTTIVTLLRCS
jgi:low affinity Fe/Cu permease